MTSATSQILRLITGSASVALLAVESPFWWIAVIPWLLLCICGIIATLPLVVVIGVEAGAAQADWMSDEFAIGLFFVMPTFFAIVIAEYVKRRAVRVVNAISMPTMEGIATEAVRATPGTR